MLFRSYTDILTPVGYYEDTYDKTSFSDNTNYSTISIVFYGELDSIDDIKINGTSSEFKLGIYPDKRFNIKGFKTYHE